MSVGMVKLKKPLQGSPMVKTVDRIIPIYGNAVLGSKPIHKPIDTPCHLTFHHFYHIILAGQNGR